MMHKPLLPGGVHPQISLSMILLFLCLVRPDLFVIHYFFVYFFKGLISFLGFLDKCYTSVFNALILKGWLDVLKRVIIIYIPLERYVSIVHSLKKL